MQQIIITLIALLGLILPVANSRITKAFQRIVPRMPMAGRMAAKSDADVVGKVPAATRPLAMYQTPSFQSNAGEPEQRPDPQQRRMRRAQRATGWRNALCDQLQALASCRGFFLARPD